MSDKKLKALIMVNDDEIKKAFTSLKEYLPDLKDYNVKEKITT
jgi:hypothetical protein